MAKKSAIERNKKRERLAERYKAKRDSLREIIRAKDDKGEIVHPIEQLLRAQLKLAELPRNSA
ncbi:MAG: 30S ribosomal protein S14, partial [Caulobacterales bacterium]|nr:30S ribosomal protein S14 [Caulobacterales bacterium]